MFNGDIGLGFVSSAYASIKSTVGGVVDVGEKLCRDLAIFVKSVEENQYSVFSVSNHIMILIRNFHRELNSVSFCQVQNEPSWKSKQTNFEFSLL